MGEGARGEVRQKCADLRCASPTAITPALFAHFPEVEKNLV